MTFEDALKELKLGKIIYNKHTPHDCFQYLTNAKIIFKFIRMNKNSNTWYLSEDDSLSFQDILDDNWEILNIENQKFIK
jgi:hypothetical protein